MAQALVTKFKSVRAANESRGIIDGLNMVMKASVDTSNEVKLEQSSDEIKDWIDDSNEARNKQYQEKVRKVDSSIQLRICSKPFPIVDYRVQDILGTSPTSLNRKPCHSKSFEDLKKSRPPVFRRPDNSLSSR